MASIIYNMRHRGPYEYDKFVLNIFQVCNDTKRAARKFSVTSNAELKKKEKNIINLLEETIKSQQKNLIMLNKLF